MNLSTERNALLIVLVLWMISMIGINSVTVVRHEILVLETARVMEASGDWVVPRFNGELRLQKPPLSYWATALVSKLDPFSSDIQVWHGRLVSLLAGLLMAVLVLRLGTRFYGVKTGLLAALLLFSMQGFVDQLHNARPDMLYASLAVLQLFLWIEAWQRDAEGRSAIWFSLLGWLAAGLATLAKGPQVPVVFLAGFVGFLLAGPDRKRILHILSPLRGVALFCVIVLPWWILLNRSLQEMGVNIEESQMSGSLLKKLASWQDLLSLYYTWRLFLEAFPVSIVFAFVVRRAWQNRKSASPVTRLLLAVCATWFVVFTLGGHYRTQYLLPVYPIVALFVAQALVLYPYPPLQGKARPIIFAIVSVAILASLLKLLIDGSFITLFLMSVAAGILFYLLKARSKADDLKGSVLTTQWIVLACLMGVVLSAGNALLTLDQRRASEQAFFTRVQPFLQPGDQLVEWVSESQGLVFYRKQQVLSFSEPEDLDSFLQQAPSGKATYVILPSSKLSEFEQFYDFDILDRIAYKPSSPRNLSFVRLSGRKLAE